MTSPARVRVEAAPNFLANLQDAHLFFVEQDADSASERLRKLKTDLREMVVVLSWSPACGHPARFFTARSAQARLRTQTVQQLAAQTGLPNLREYIVNRHIVLYAHSEVEVVLLALKHQRQLTYSSSASL